MTENDRRLELKWVTRFIQLARTIATWSKDPSSKVAAVITTKNMRTISIGYNGFPMGIEDTEERLQNKDLKNSLIIHAERNAILNSTFNLEDCCIYVTKFPCKECAKSIIQSGITKVVSETPDPTSSWKQNMRLGFELLLEAEIEVYLFDSISGKLYQPDTLFEIA